MDTADLYISAITIQELEIGVLRAERKDDKKGDVSGMDERSCFVGVLSPHFIH